MSKSKQTLKMIIDGDNHDGLLTVFKGEKLTWPVNRTWNSLKRKETDRIFGFVNRYIEMQDEAFSEKLFKLYSQSRVAMESNTSLEETSKELAKICSSVVSMFSYNKMLPYVKELVDKEEIFIDHSLISKTNTKYDKERTYVLSEYLGLLAMTLTVKPLAPIWALYNKSFSPEGGSKVKEIRCVEMIENSSLASTPAYSKLAEYTEISGKKYIDNSTYVVTVGISKVDQPKYFLSFIIVRKLIQADLTTENLITSVFMAVNILGKEFQSNLKIHAMSVNSEDAKESSIGDFKGTPEYIKEHYIIIAGEYAKDRHNMLKCEMPQVTKEEMTKLDQYYGELMAQPMYVLQPAFFSIIGCILNTVSPKAVMLMQDEGKQSSISVAAVKLERYGLYDLSMFIRSVATETEPGIIDGSVFSTNHFTLRDELEACYHRNHTISEKAPFLSPGHENIIAIENFVNSHDLSCGKSNIVDIQNSVAKLLIKRNEGPL